MTNLIKYSFLKNGEKVLAYRVRLVGSKGLLAFRSHCVSSMQQQQQTGRRVEFYKGNCPKGA